MRILAVDVGTGTQDILLFDSDQPIENSVKMIMPSPTQIVASAIRDATAAGEDVLLEGYTMGGGPSGWAVEDHLRQGRLVWATPAAAFTINDDLAEVVKLGVKVVEPAKTATIRARHIEFRDVDLAAIMAALAQFYVDPRLDAIAVAVFDHGAAPPGFSDRLFRFQYLARHVDAGLTAFAHDANNIPPTLTRMQAVARCLRDDGCQLPVVLMDTGPAAVLGALEDPLVRQAASALVVNVGNFHTLAFHLDRGRIAGVIEHHTGLLDRPKLEDYLSRLVEGTLTNDEVFADSGHGALLTPGPRRAPDVVAVTGPRRGLLHGSRLDPYFAVPHGDMMVAGCFGLLRAAARILPSIAPAVERGLATQ